MTVAFRGWAALLAALCWPMLARAGPPDLDVADLARGEAQAETNAWRSDAGWTVRPELEFGLTDRLGLELQADLARNRGNRAQLRNVSAQLMAGLSSDGAVGLAAEVGYDPHDKEVGLEAFAFGARQVGPWRFEGNAGLEREGGETALGYAWRVERALGGVWSAGVEGGGEAPLRRGHDEHLAGPTLAVKAPHSPFQLRFGWFFDLAGREDAARVGLDYDF